MTKKSEKPLAVIRGDEDGRETALEFEEAVGLASAVVTLLRRQTKGPQDAVLVSGNCCLYY